MMENNVVRNSDSLEKAKPMTDDDLLQMADAIRAYVLNGTVLFPHSSHPALFLDSGDTEG